MPTSHHLTQNKERKLSCFQSLTGWDDDITISPAGSLGAIGHINLCKSYLIARVGGGWRLCPLNLQVQQQSLFLSTTLNLYALGCIWIRTPAKPQYKLDWLLKIGVELLLGQATGCFKCCSPMPVNNKSHDSYGTTFCHWKTQILSYSPTGVDCENIYIINVLVFMVVENAVFDLRLPRRSNTAHRSLLHCVYYIICFFDFLM